MFERLEATRALTANQWRIVVAAIIGDMLGFFDYFLIGFVLAFIVGPWQLTFGQIILLSSGIGTILSAAVWGRLADRIGRRAVFIGTVLTFSIATGVLALTPDHGWIFLTIFCFSSASASAGSIASTCRWSRNSCRHQSAALSAAW
jgi:MFS transporter, putative metabolite:H+ symporter